MDCHRCEFLKYDGCRYGRCTHPGHLEVKFVMKSQRKDKETRPYNKEMCNDFRLKKKCSNCKKWIRGEYYADGKTPAKRGSCSIGISGSGKDCQSWEIGPTSWRKRRQVCK